MEPPSLTLPVRHGNTALLGSGSLRSSELNQIFFMLFFCRYLPLSCWNQVRMLLKGRLSAQQANSARANSAVGRVFLVCCTYIRQSEWGPGWKIPCGNNEKCFYSVWLSCMIALLGKWKTTMKLFSRDQFNSSLSHLFDMGINKYTLQMICVSEMRRFIYLVSLFTNKRRLICGH